LSIKHKANRETMASSEKGAESWADETSAATDSGSQPAAVKAEAEKDTSSLANAQTDGATEALNGGSGIYEPSYEVNVKLSDLQEDANNPLYSIASFEDLGL